MLDMLDTLTQRLFRTRETVDTSPPIEDEAKYTTCYMCACRCGIKVHLRDGRIRYIEGNKDHPINRGVLCGKGSAGIMQQYSPARLTKPLLRVGERGTPEFKEIEWEEALTIATTWLGQIRASDPRKLAFFTGRDQSQSLTAWWAAQFGTPNFAAHGGFCSVNMAMAGLYTIGSAFWEFGDPDWDHTRLFMLFGVAEDHDSNPIKIGISKLKARGAKFISVNPVKTGYSAIADEWIGIRPGTDGLFVLALIHELLRADKLDLEFLVRTTNAPWLVILNPGGGDDALFARGEDHYPLAWDTRTNKAVSALLADITPAVVGTFTLPDGRRAAPAFQLLAERYLDAQYAPDAVAARCGVDAPTIRRIAAELAHAAFEQPVILDQPWTDWAGRRHDKTIGRPVSFHAMRGISAHSNGFHTCRALHVLQMLLGAVDGPGSWRYKAPYPRPCPPGPKPAKTVRPGEPLDGSPLGDPLGPEDLLVATDGTPQRIDKAFSWEAPLAGQGLMHMVIANAVKGDPYKIDTLFMYMTNIAWNSAMNTAGTIAMLTQKEPDGSYTIPRFIYADANFSETVAYADLVLPDTTYLERWDCISLLDRPISSAEGPADAIRQPVIKPDRDVRPFQDVLIDLGARLGLPGFVTPDGNPRYPGGYPDYIVNHERLPGIGPLAGWRGRDGELEGTGAPNPRQLEQYIAHQCFWKFELPPEALYYKHSNKAYLEIAQRFGFVERAEQIVLQLYCEPLQRFRLAAQGHGAVQPPERLRTRVAAAFDPLPIWYPPFLETIAGDEFPLHAITQRPMQMYHSWGSHNAWLRQIIEFNRLYVNRATGTALGLADGDWAWVVSHHGRVKVQLQLMEGCEPNTVWTWNGIGKRAGAWNLDPASGEAHRGFLLNHVIPELLPERDGMRLSNSDPVTGQAAWYDLKVRLEKCLPDEAGETAPLLPPLRPPKDLPPRPSLLRYGAEWRQ